MKHLESVSISDRPSYGKMSWTLEVARLEVQIIASLEIWQAHWQHCCRGACQISKRSDNSKYKSRGFDTLRDLKTRRFIWYWNGAWAPSQYPKRRLIVRSREVSKPRDLYLELSNRSEIWQAPRQRCCRSACQISKRCDDLNFQSRGFETSRDLTIRRLIGYWNGAQVTKLMTNRVWSTET